MPTTIGNGVLPTAREVRDRALNRSAEKADDYLGRLTEAEMEKRAFIETLGKRSGALERQTIKLVSAVIQRAAQDGLNEVQIFRFPNSLCTDQGLAIRNGLPAWEKTLAGLASEIYQVWSDYLRPLGYRIRFQFDETSGELSENIAIIFSWDD